MNAIVEELLKHLDEDLRETFEERAAIAEFDGKLSRDHAECLSMLYILRGNPEVLTGTIRKEWDLI